MFNSQNNNKAVVKPIKRVVSPKDAAVTILTSGCHFNGKLFCRGSSRIGGKIEGHIVSEGLLIIEEEAMIVAEIRADEAVIQGKVQGKLEASGRVELTASSWFEGDISTPVLVINEGAQFNGRAFMASISSADQKPGKGEHANGNDHRKDRNKGDNDIAVAMREGSEPSPAY